MLVADEAIAALLEAVGVAPATVLGHLGGPSPRREELFALGSGRKVLEVAVWNANRTQPTGRPARPAAGRPVRRGDPACQAVAEAGEAGTFRALIYQLADRDTAARIG